MAAIGDVVTCFPPYPIREECRRPSQWVRLWGRALRLAFRASATRPKAFWPAFSRAAHLLGCEQFNSGEIRQLGLLAMPPGVKPLPAVSRRAMVRIAEALNPADARPRVGDKGVFNRECERRGLPAPRLLGIFAGDHPGRAVDGSVPDGPDHWRHFFQHVCPGEFVIKPLVAGYGRDVRVLFRTGHDDFRDATGAPVDSDGLLAWMTAAGRGRGCVIQERVRSHADLQRFSGSRHLQTARLITLLDRAGEPHLLHAHFKIITGSNFVDNFYYGATGNLIASINLEHGALGTGRTADPRGGFAGIGKHPDTGVLIAGFQLPDWTAVRQLALRAAREFAPLRLVGWDIALTPGGPVVIEGNWNTDPPNHGGRMDRVIGEIRKWA